MNEAASLRGEADDGIAAATGAIDEAEQEIERLNAERHEDPRLVFDLFAEGGGDADDDDEAPSVPVVPIYTPASEKNGCYPCWACM